MKISDVKGNDMNKLLNLYNQEKDNLFGEVSLEEFCERFIRKCEDCGELIVVYDDWCQLNVGYIRNGKEIRVCDDCYYYSEMYEEERIKNSDDDSDAIDRAYYRYLDMVMDGIVYE